MRIRTVSTWLCLALALSACEARTTAPEPVEPSGASAAEPTIPTQEESEAFYAEEIGTDEFDEELDKLMDEIAADEELAGDS